MKNKNLKFVINKNTDTVDIREKCLGLTTRIENMPELNNNRGLCIQIRHNKDKATFKAACQLEILLSAAPDLLDTLEFVKRVLYSRQDQDMGLKEAFDKIEKALEKAKGQI